MTETAHHITKHPYDAILDIMKDSSHFLSENELDSEKELDPFFQKLSLFKSAGKMQREISELKRKSRKLFTINRAVDILRPEEMEAKLRTVELLLQSFESCVVDLPRLQDALCRPFHGNSLKIHRKYHDSCEQFLHDCASMLERFQHTLDTLRWHKTNRSNSAATTNVLEKFSSSVEELKRNWSITEETFQLLQVIDLKS